MANHLKKLKLLGSALSAFLFAGQVGATSPPVKEPIDRASAGCSPLLDFQFKRLGEERYENLCKTYQGKLVLVVNTASKCSFTPQYDGLEQLYRGYQARGLVVLGFPSNDFAGQEPGSEEQILEFCRLTYSVEFPMFEKVHAARGKAHPFYQRLAQEAGTYPRWNFHKYLIGPDGKLIDNFSSMTRPSSSSLIKVIEANLPSS